MKMLLRNGWIAGVCLMAGQAFALDAVPPQVLFNTLDSVAQVQINDAGAPLAAGDITSWRLMIDDSNYAHMIKVTPVAGGIQVQPSPSLQVGTYNLEVTTKRGVIIVPIDAPLSGETGPLEEAMKGKTREEAMVEIGLGQRLDRDGSFRISLPPTYVVGQEIRVNAPEAAGVSYRWSVNGAVIGEGNSLSYIIPGEGEYTVQLEQRSGAGDWLPAGVARTMAQEQPPEVLTVKRNQRISLRAPAGYGSYVWTRDNTTVGTDASLVVSFPQPGVYTVSCRCAEPAAGPAGGFYNVRFQLTVE